MKLVTHEQLWEFAQSVEYTRKGAYRSGALDPIGLLLHELPDKNYKPGCTNLWTFAGTGGDFVTFNYLLEQPICDEKAPVILNVPANTTRRTLVVGANLYDFLCLGCEIGFFHIEQYSYSPNEFIDMYEHPAATWKKFEEEEERQLLNSQFPLSDVDYRSVSAQQSLLRRLSQQFDLHPWKDIRSKLKQLQTLKRPKGK